MLNDMELQARIDHFLHRKKEQFPELAPKSGGNRRALVATSLTYTSAHAPLIK